MGGGYHEDFEQILVRELLFRVHLSQTHIPGV